MCRKIRTIKVQNSHNARLGKCGFTLVELCVVLALVAILGTMTVSFSVMFNNYTNGTQAEYVFLEDSAALHEELSDWIAQNDASDVVFEISADGTLTVGGQTVSFSEGTLRLGEKKIGGFNEIDSISFSTNGTLIKCVTYHIANNGDVFENVFVISLRCGSVEAVE